MEPLAAVLAGVRPRVRVDEQVRGKSGGAFECLATHFALEALFLFKDKCTRHVTQQNEQDVRQVELQTSSLAFENSS